MAADPNVVSLQNAINRFAAHAGFAAIGIDGQLGTFTASALLKALAWVANNVPGASETASGLTARLVLETGSYNLEQMRTSASGLATYLNQNANAVGLPVAPQPAVASGGGGGGGGGGYTSTPAIDTSKWALPGSGGGVAASVGDFWRKMPTWGKVASGAVFGLGLLVAIGKMKRKSAGA
jgi:hypothetical protein